MENITLKKLETDDLDQFIALIRLFEKVFEREDFTPPPVDHLSRLLKKEDFLVFAALLDGKVTGGITAYVLDQYYSEKPLAYIYDLAVDTPLQRKGIGQTLINAINQHCQDHGFEEVFVQAETEDEHAVAFYRATKPVRESNAIDFTYTM